MFSTRVDHILRNRVRPEQIGGVLSSDQLLDSHLLGRLDRGFIFIVNTAPSDSLGEHWYLLAGDGRKKAYYIDSLGEDLEDRAGAREFLEYATDSDVTPITLPWPIQGESQVCGLYCLYFARTILKLGWSLAEAILPFSPGKGNRNDAILIKILETRRWRDQ